MTKYLFLISGFIFSISYSAFAEEVRVKAGLDLMRNFENVEYGGNDSEFLDEPFGSNLDEEMKSPAANEVADGDEGEPAWSPSSRSTQEADRLRNQAHLKGMKPNFEYDSISEGKDSDESGDDFTLGEEVIGPNDPFPDQTLGELMGFENMGGEKGSSTKNSKNKADKGTKVHDVRDEVKGTLPLV